MKSQNAQSPVGLNTLYKGIQPAGYETMQKEGAVVLGMAGQVNIYGQGTFSEGVLTSGYPSDATENAVQANVVSAGSTVSSLVSGPVFKPGSTITQQATTPGVTDHYLADSGDQFNIQRITSSVSSARRKTGSWVVRTGLRNKGCFSFESWDTPGSYIRQNDFRLYVNAPDGSKQFKEDATFCTLASFNGLGTSIRRGTTRPAGSDIRTL